MNKPHVCGAAASPPPEGVQLALGATRREI